VIEKESEYRQRFGRTYEDSAYQHPASIEDLELLKLVATIKVARGIARQMDIQHQVQRNGPILQKELAHLPDEFEKQKETVALWDRYRGQPPSDGVKTG